MSVHRLTPASHDDDKRNDIIYSENITTLSADSQNEAGHAGVSPAAFQPRSLPSLSIPSSNDTTTEFESDFPRSTSATSSLDPYYFSIPSRHDSPIPPLPVNPILKESNVFREPMTPARDPASIDRNALVGVGELLSPRWPSQMKEDGNIEGFESVKGQDWAEDKEDPDNDGRGSPWTIEAIDGEPDEFERARESSSADIGSQKEARHFIGDESGGEEIVYPRKPVRADAPKPQLDSPPSKAESQEQAPPSAFFSPTRKAKKRSSDEFVLDQSGLLAPKSATGKNSSSQGREKSDLQVLRKHQSLAINSSSSSSARDRRRGGSVRLSMTAPSKTGVATVKNLKHSRQPSASSLVSAQNDFSHKYSNDDLHKVATAGSQKRTSGPSAKSSSEKLLVKEKEVHSSPSVAHSLLRGTQEGWSGLDDDATAEALRKLDGVSGKGARARTSIGPISRLSNHSRPSTPGTNKGHRSEGNEGTDRLHRANSIGNSTGRSQEKSQSELGRMTSKESRTLGIEQSIHVEGDKKGPKDALTPVRAGDEFPVIPAMPDLEVRKPVPNARLSFTPKRGSASSTNYTGTPTLSSRDSAILSAGTSATSASVGSNRLSLIKARRNSAGSDISSIHSAEVGSQRDRVASLTIGDTADDATVPPVPPLPKDLSSYRTPPQSSASLIFPSTDASETDAEHTRLGTDHLAPTNPARNQKIETQNLGTKGGLQSSSSVLKTPSKKWSFTSALSIRRSASPGRHEHSGAKSAKRESRATAKQIRPSSSKDSSLLHTISPKSSVETWQRIQRGAMASESSLASLSSLSSFPEPSPPISPSHNLRTSPSLTTDHESRAGTASSFNMGQASLTDNQLNQESPTSRVPQASSNKRLTPSSIPFFRRSSSQSMQTPASSGLVVSTSPTISSSPTSRQGIHRSDILSPKDLLTSPTTPGHSQRKSSMLSLGLPSILKGSSSRKSVHVDKNMGIRDSDVESRARDSGTENLKTKKDDKDRSESRISVLMGRKRGKTLSSTDQKKVKPITLPPMQVSAIPQTTAERLAYVQSNASTSTPSRSSRATSQTISSMQKQSDSSLRNSRQQLPTIAGSPSVGQHSHSSHSKDQREQGYNHQSTSFSGSMSHIPKETPTRIPRIASRSSTVTSPALKSSSSILASKRASLIVGPSIALEDQTSDSIMEDLPNEFGVLSIGEMSKGSNSATYRQQTRISPTGTSKGTRQSSAYATTSSAQTPRKPVPEPIAVKTLRKSSTGSVSSMTSLGAEHHSALSALSPSKGLNKLLSPKMSLPGSRLSGSSTAPNLHQQQQQSGSPTSHRQSISTPSPVPSTVDEDEILGDEEMMQYIKRTQARKMAHGASREELEELLKFPEPLPPGRPSSPTSVLNCERTNDLSDFERKEILDYPSVYYIGRTNAKKMATRDSSSSNYGYDDDRGDYQVINHDHLAYRYEIIDTLGKGSFGQVLHCRDHCSGESVAIKIIRNKKRFHHQALVEIKILENLRKWDPDEKHHVIKMTEHFYFRNHLCIAMELLSINLYELIKANGFAGFSTTLIRRFTSQMLMSLSLMRHHRVVHCDLKPENVLLRHPAKSGLKVIDFGSSCLEHEKVYTYIQSRFYRSPEVILGMNYNMAIDMWSLGCILAELYTGYPIFPGENEQEQLSCIMEVLGVPDKDLINRSSRKRLFFDSTGAPRPVVNSKGRRRRAGTKTLAQVLRCDDELFVDFVSKCLSWDPERRIKPQSAMRHPFITAGRKSKIVNNATPSSTRTHLASSSSLLSVGRSKPTETPKKSQISAPTPLTARTTRTMNSQIPSTPLGPLAHPTQSSSKSFRSPHVSYHSSRTAGGLTMTATK